MTDLLIQIGVSNLCISVGMAMVALAVQKTGKRPFVAHLLWLLVLAKMVTPPVLTIPLVAVPGTSVATAETFMDPSRSGLDASHPDNQAIGTQGALLSAPRWSAAVEQGKTGLTLIWLLGGVGVLAWSLVRTCRFNRLLGMASKVAPPQLQRTASEIAHRLGLAATPTVYTTAAQISPLVWWLGGRVRPSPPRRYA